MKKWFWIELGAINLLLISALTLRFYKIDTTPGYEWDEPIYTYIDGHYSDHGYPVLKAENSLGQEPYLYHPPFDFALRNYFFKISDFEGVTSARLISVLAAGLTLLLIYNLLKKITDSRISLVACLLIATDSWLIYTNRLNLLENLMLPIGISAIAVFYHAVKKQKSLGWFAFSGILLAFAAIYKHTGIFFLGVPLLYLFFTKKNPKKYLLLYMCMATTVAIYILFMDLRWGNLYIDQTIVQIKRTLGIYNSRGLNYSISDAINAVFGIYWLYMTTILTLVIGGLLVIKNTINYLRTKITPSEPLLLSWALAALIFFGAISLKNPQYIIMVLTPLYIYLSAKIIRFLRENKYKKIKYYILLILLAVNAFTFYLRFVRRNDNAILATYDFVNTLPDTSIVLTEESIGVGIKQIYYKLDLHNSTDEISRVKPNYVIIYVSSTQRLPSSKALEELIRNSLLIKEFDGFKEKILVYQI